MQSPVRWRECWSLSSCRNARSCQCSLKQPAIEKENACPLSCRSVRLKILVEFSDVLDISILQARTEHERALALAWGKMHFILRTSTHIKTPARSSIRSRRSFSEEIPASFLFRILACFPFLYSSQCSWKYRQMYSLTSAN